MLWEGGDVSTCVCAHAHTPCALCQAFFWLSSMLIPSSLSGSPSPQPSIKSRLLVPHQHSTQMLNELGVQARSPTLV